MKILQLLSMMVLLAISGIVEGKAQTSDEENNVAWNGYETVERLPSTFVSIVPDIGTFFIAGSESLDPYVDNQTVPITLPFDFLLNRRKYLAGSELRAGITGVLSLNQFDVDDPDEPIMLNAIGSYHLSPYPVDGMSPEESSHLLAPFWGEFTSVSPFGPSGGIYTKHEVLVDHETFTIEWHVRPYNTIDRLGSFQVKFVRFFDSTLTDNYWIEYHYDSENALVMPEPTLVELAHKGAFVGMKHEGQEFGNPESDITPTPEPNPGEDDEKLLIITSPDHYLSDHSFTRLNTRKQGAVNYVPDLFASNPLTATPAAIDPSPLFHFTFPTVGYRSKPIESDLESMSGEALDPELPLTTVMAGTPSLFNPTDDIWIDGVFRNNGTTAKQNLVVSAEVRQGNQLVDQLDATIPTIDVGSEVTIRFPRFLNKQTVNAPGLYTVCLTTSDPTDGDHTNDITRFAFIIRESTDLMPTTIMEPELSKGRVRHHYAAGNDVPIRVRYLNSGNSVVTNAQVGYRILSEDNQVLYETDITLTESWGPMETREVQFQPWQNASEGTYYIEAWSSHQNDAISDNDALRAQNSIEKYRFNSCSPSSTVATDWAFGILPGVEIEVGEPGVLPHWPGVNESYNNSVPVIITLRNNGALDVTNLPVNVRIKDAGGIVVYDKTEILSSISAGRGLSYLTFPDFVSSTPGSYTLEANAPLAGDNYIENNDATWPFTMGSPLKMIAGEKNLLEEGIVQVAPNPAQENLVLRYSLQQRAEGTVSLLDMQGRGVKEWHDQKLEQEGSVVLNVQDIPAGVYMIRLALESGKAVYKRVVIMY